MSNLIGKKFEYNLLKGEIKIVKEIKNDLVIFEDDGRVPVERFDELFTEVQGQGTVSTNEAKRILFNNEELDPKSFFDGNTHNQLLEKLKREAENIDLNKIPQQVVSTNTPVTSRVEEPAVKKILVETDESGKTTSKEESSPAAQSSDFFKKMKRTYDVKINIQLAQRIPNLDFIKMMDENFDQGILEYLVSEITEEILASPQIIHTQVKKQLQDLMDNKEIKKAKKKNSKNVAD